MNNISAVTTVMRRRLELLGYPTDDIRWSLGYCQGDGASFTGRLDLKALGARLMPDVSSKIWEDCGVSLEITRSGSYVHERSTSLNESSETIASGDPSEYNGVACKYAIGTLVGLLEKEIVEVGTRMAEDGYKVLESYFAPDSDKKPVWAFSTACFRVEVFKTEDTDYSPFELCDDEYLDETVAEMTSGDWEVCGSKVVVSLIDEDGDVCSQLAETHVGGYSYKKSGPVFGSRSTMRELVSEAISEARDAFHKIKRPRLKLAA